MSPSDMEPPNPSPSSHNPEVARLREVVDDLQRRVTALELGAIPAPSIPTKNSSQSDRFGLKLVNRIGAFTLALGIIFFFKYAVDNEWVGAAGRVFLGMTVGGLLLVAGDWLRRRQQQVFAQGLAGCGLATLYISIYSSSAYYKLLSEPLAFLALLLLCAFTLFLSIRFASVASAVLAFMGALLTPLLLHFLQPDSWAVFEVIYLILLVVTELVIASLQHWGILVPLVAAFSLITAIAQINPRHSFLFVLFLISLALSNFVLPQFLSQATSIRPYSYVVGHCAILLTILRVMALWAEQNVITTDRVSFLSEAGSVLIALYGIAVLVFGISRRSALDRTFALALLGLVILKLYLYDVWLLTRFYRISAFVALGILLLTASYVYSRSKAH